MNGSYDALLVVLSVLIAIFASYTALDLANSVTVARGQSLDLVRLTAAKAAMTISAEDALANDCHVMADEQRLKQVLLNLLSNAVKYNRPEGTVTVECEPTDDDRLRISVRDTGYGIPGEKLDRLFTPFDRLGAERSGTDGVGLGLVLSRGLIDAMGGTLSVHSVEGEGSCFGVVLPRAPLEMVRRIARPTPVAEAPRAAPDRDRTVLVVEDNPANIRLVERIFQRRARVRLLTAVQGSMGLQLARDYHPDLILLDLNLPDIQGDELLRRLREDPETAAIPVVMISGDATPAQVRRLLDLGAEAYLTKPFDVQELLRLIDTKLRRPDDG